jgi:8-oxo-dGTP pyrophosphatase MutT (NUDIX family)
MSAHLLIDKFRSSFLTELPGETAHADLMPVNRPFSSHALRKATNYRQSAVGIVLHQHNNAVHCVLIQRPDYPGVHGKQISFPGGKMDLDDPDLEFTAKREIHEEISVQPELLETIGQLTEVYIPVSKFLVQPYVFYLHETPELIPDPREVQEVFSFEIESLLQKDIIRHTDMRLGNGLIQKNIPYFDINGKVVWGATAMILSEVRAIMHRF